MYSNQVRIIGDTDTRYENNSLKNKKTDSEINQKKIDKKFLTKAAAIGIGALVLGGVLLHKRGNIKINHNGGKNVAENIYIDVNNAPEKVQKEVSQKKDIIIDKAKKNASSKTPKWAQDVADSTIQKGREVFDEVDDFIKKGAETDFTDVFDKTGRLIRKFETTEIDGKKVATKMTEYGSNGQKCRVTTIEKGAPYKVEEFVDFIVEGTAKQKSHKFPFKLS